MYCELYPNHITKHKIFQQIWLGGPQGQIMHEWQFSALYICGTKVVVNLLSSE